MKRDKSGKSHRAGFSSASSCASHWTRSSSVRPRGGFLRSVSMAVASRVGFMSSAPYLIARPRTLETIVTTARKTSKGHHWSIPPSAPPVEARRMRSKRSNYQLASR